MFVPRAINLIGFGSKEVILDQLKTVLTSFSKLLNLLSNSLLKLYRVLPSAKVHTSDIPIKKSKSFINKLKSKCPRTDT